jgi:hypothetical protein
VRHASVQLVLIGLMGCGGGNAGSTASTPTDADAIRIWQDYCDQLQTRGCMKTCEPAACIAKADDPASLQGYVNCLLQTTCGAHDDQCWSVAGTQNGMLPSDRQSFFDQCTAFVAQCGIQTPTLQQSGICGTAFPIVKREWMDRAEHCLKNDCARAAACATQLSTDLACPS